jgi:hypothetical protein
MAASFVAAASVAYGDVAQELLDEDVPDVDFAAARCVCANKGRPPAG